MAYQDNPFREGQEVVCISENFPCFLATGEDKSCVGKQAPSHPKLNEILAIDEILGEFLRFTQYDTEESFMWWHHNRFRSFDEMANELAEREAKKLRKMVNDELKSMESNQHVS